MTGYAAGPSFGVAEWGRRFDYCGAGREHWIDSRKSNAAGLNLSLLRLER
jgi:hypothetical protein